MLIETTLLGTTNKEEKAIRRIQEFAPQDGKLYLVGFSGGKDSLVIWHLVKRSGCPYILMHAPTIEFKETYQYIRSFPEKVHQVPPKRWKNSQRPEWNGKPKTMFNLIANRSIPPTRKHPYCCANLKENVGVSGDVILLGVRSAESNARNQRKVVNFWQGKINVNPIVDWLDDDVWEYIHKYKLPYNPLYDMGACRVGCPGCPKSSNQKQELIDNPQWYKFYLAAFKAMLKNQNTECNTSLSWKTPEDVMQWWLGECAIQRKELDGQCEFM